MIMKSGKPVKDTRHLFSNVPKSRKADSWDEVGSFIPTPAQREAILTKPIIFLDLGSTPNHRVPEFVDGDYIGRFGSEFIGIHNGRCFYIQPEGYSYPKYVVLISLLTPLDLGVTEVISQDHMGPFEMISKGIDLLEERLEDDTDGFTTQEREMMRTLRSRLHRLI